MREILFRGKTYSGVWKEGLPSYDCCGKIAEIQVFEENGDEFYLVIPETVGQWTGKLLNSNLTDKEEKLFDGDVIGWSEDYDDKFGYPATYYGKGVIVWNEANCCFGVKTSETNIQDFNDFDFDDSCVIIGSIHDNPDLLKGEDAE